METIVKQIIDAFTGVEYAYLEQLKAFAKVFRNPIGRVVNIAFYAVVKLDEKVIAKSREKGGIWINYNEIPDMAYDHNEIVDYAKERLRRCVKRRPIGFYLLPKHFTIHQLQRLYECALDKPLDKRNFRKKIFKSQLIVETGLTQPGTRKEAKLYKFDEDKFEKMSLKGYDFLF